MPGLAGLGQRGPDDLLADAVDLQVELDAGDAVLRAGDLEVHVAEVVLVADDVGRAASNLSPSFTRPIEMPATGLVIGTPAAIRASVPPQTLAIELEPFDSRMSEIDADRVGELVGVGHAPA